MPNRKRKQSPSIECIIFDKPVAESESNSMLKDGNDSTEAPDEFPNAGMPNRTENQSSSSQSTISRSISTPAINRASREYLYESEGDEHPNINKLSTNTLSFGDWICRYRVQLLIFIVPAIAIMLIMASIIIVNYIKIAELEQMGQKILHKSVMLYRPTEKYLMNKNRPEAVEWRLVEEHSQNPVTQFNTTHLRVKEDGVYDISCSMLIEIDIKRKMPSSITLLVYSIGEKPIYAKKYMSTVFSIQQSIILKLHQGDTIFVEIHPSKLLSKASDASHLSIVQQ